MEKQKEKMEVFKQGWRYLRDNFFDDKFNGANWDQVRATYEPLVAAARTMDETRRLMNMMVGELNASHLGVGGPSGFTATPVGKLGLRFDRAEYENNGRLKITEIITLGPAAVTKSINVGDYLISVDGTKIGSGVNLDEILEGKTNRRLPISVSASADGSNKRDVLLKPISTNAESETGAAARPAARATSRIPDAQTRREKEADGWKIQERARGRRGRTKRSAGGAVDRRRLTTDQFTARSRAEY